jgi:NTP pyrophosphatase (non-canonical NTP hydrolase)
MNFQDFLSYIDVEDQRLKQRYPDLDNQKAILARAVKLSEEMGELCDNLLASLGLQRKNKMEKYTARNLSDEFADLIITTALLAKSAGVDIQQALEQKIPELNQRQP